MQDRLEEAEKLCREALRLDPSYASAYGCLGHIALERGRLGEAEEFFLRSIRVNRRDGSFTDLGALYVQMARYAEAEEKLKNALEINRHDTQAHIELGNLFLQMDKSQDAIRFFRTAMAIDPNSDDPPRGLAIALMRAGDFLEAEKVLRTSLRRLDESRRWRLHLTLSQLLLNWGEKTGDTPLYEHALKEVRSAGRLKPKHPDVNFQAGLVHFKVRNYWRALKSFSDCLDQDRYHADAERNIRQLKRLLGEEVVKSRGGLYGGLLLGSASAFTLYFFFWHFVHTGLVKEGSLLIIAPILLSFILLSALMPWLSKLKLPGGMEAELSQPKETVSGGPAGVGSGGFSPTYGSSTPTFGSSLPVSGSSSQAGGREP